MITDGTLKLYLAGALEPHEAADLGLRLAHDPRLRSRLSRVKTSACELPSPGPWRLPPPRLSPPGRVVGADVLGSLHLRVGEVCRVLIPSPLDAPREVMLLRQDPEGAWQVVSPGSPEERVDIGQLDREGDWLCVDFLTRPPPGDQVWAVALPPSALLDPVDFARPDWGAIQAEVQRGRIPLTTVDISVEA